MPIVVNRFFLENWKWWLLFPSDHCRSGETDISDDLSLIDNRLRREIRGERRGGREGRGELWFLAKVSIDVIALSDIYVKFVRFVIESGLILSCFDCQYVSKYIVVACRIYGPNISTYFESYIRYATKVTRKNG